MNFTIKTAMVGIAIVMFLCLISSVSALTSLDFTLNEEKATDLTAYGKVILSDRFFLDVFGWFETPIQELTLTDNTEVCSGSECYAMIDITLHEKGKIVDMVKFDNIREDGSRTEGHPFSYQFYTRGKAIETEIIDYETQCIDGKPEINGSVSQVCSQVQIGSHIETSYEWLPYNYEEVEAGNYTLKLIGTIPYGKTYDWIITSQGKEIDEWAVWGVGTNNLTVDLKSYKTFNETSGTTALDSVNTSLNGLRVGDAGWRVGKIGYSAYLDGNDKINMTEGAIVPAGDKPISVSVWANRTNGVVINPFVELAQTTQFLFLTDGDNIRCGFRGTNTLATYTGGNNYLNNWHHFACVYNGGAKDSNNSYSLYINGALYETGKGMMTAGGGSVKNEYGADGGGAGTYVGGLDEIGIWNRSLTAGEITMLYNGGDGIKYPFTQSGITLLNPVNTYISNNPTLILNVSILHSQTLKNTSLWINGVINETKIITGKSNVSLFTKTFAIGYYNWTIQACDIDNDCAFAIANRSFTIDNIAPTVNVSYGNGTFNYGSLTTNHTINYTATDTLTGLSRCWLDYNAVNTTIPCTSGSINTTNFQLVQNVYNAIIWANDTAKNVGSYAFNWSYAFFGGTSVYEANVSETNSSTFSFEIDTSSDILFQYGLLNYNGTNHLSTSECSGSSCYFNITIDIPLVTTTAGSQLKNFNWNLTLFDGTTSSNLVTDKTEQNVSKIYLRKCNAVYTAKALNFSLQEEETRASMGNFSFDGSFNYWLGSGTVKQNHSFTNSTNQVIDVCILPNATYYMDAIIDYEKDNSTYVDRTYYFLNHSISGVYQEFILYLLNSTSSTSFIQLVENQQSQAVEDALIYVYRYYPEIGEYKIVQVTKTNEQGKSVGFYKTESVDYKHIIVKSGITLLETALTKIFPESSPYTLTFRVGSGVEIPYSDLEDDPTVVTTLTFNVSTNITRFTWISLDSKVQWGRLLVYQQKHDSLDILICNETLAFPSGVLTCDVSGYDGTFVAYAYISKSPEKFIKSISFVISTGRAIFGNLGILLGWFIILTVCLIFIWNPTAMIVAANLAIIFVAMIGLIEFAPIFIFGIIAVSVIAIIFLKT